MLELCDSASDAAGVYEADALVQAMTTLRPQRVDLMLRHCLSRPSAIGMRGWPARTTALVCS